MPRHCQAGQGGDGVRLPPPPAPDVRWRLEGLAAAPGHEYVAALLTDPAGRLQWVSQGVALLTGVPAETWVGRWAAEALEPGSWPKMANDPAGAPDSPLMRRLRQPEGFMVEASIGGGQRQRRWRLVTAWGQPQFAADGQWVGHVVRLMPEGRARSRMYRRDPLTHLWDRTALEARWPAVLEGAAWAGCRVLVVLLNLDDFKTINQGWGYAAGDRVLAMVARRLLTATPADRGAWFRLGGDEFLGVYYAEGESAVLPWLNRCRDSLAAPLPVTERDMVRLEASMGLAWADPQGLRAESLHRADLAMFSAKAAKVSRASWWRWWKPGLSPEAEDAGAVNPFGTAAQRLLGEARGAFASLDPVAVLAAQHAFRTRQGLLESMAKAMAEALNPALSDAEHAGCCRAIGEVTALAGAHAASVAQAWTAWSHQLTLTVLQLSWPPARKLALAEAIAQRINASLDREMQAHTQTLRAYQAALRGVQNVVRGLTRWPDVVQATLQRLVGLPGMRAALLTRPDAQGRWVVEFAAGEAAAVLGTAEASALLGHTALHRHWLANAWATGRITARRDWTSSLSRRWQGSMRRRGLVAAAAIPIQDESGNPASVLVLFGSVAGMFSTPEVRLACQAIAAYLREAWRRADAQRSPEPPLPQLVGARYRQLVAAGAVRFFGQPVVRLSDGQCLKVEFLARLAPAGQELVSPGQFLRAFGHHELIKLFLSGLRAAVDQLAQWQREGISVTAAINLPLDVLAVPECVDWVREALQAASVPAERLELELLETAAGEKEEIAARHAVALRQLGVGLSMDDLGAGYSGLKRLRQWPFSSAKVDWALVREVHHAPAQTVGFLGGLVRILHDLGLTVVMEGLESPDLVEMARELGADFGQGYAISVPAPLEALALEGGPSWLRGPSRPTTELGHLALAWRLRHAESPTSAPAT